MNTPLRILAIGAHPDDCDVAAGGVATMYRMAGHEVRFVSVTNGEAGHQQRTPEELIRIRRQEAEAAGRILGIRYDVLKYRDARLEPTLEARCELIGLIRESRPDLILTHRPNDYHPDHRATSQLVCDASFLVTVPLIVPEVPALREMPVIAYVADDFERPYPFSPTVVVDVEPAIDRVVDMLDCHQSQFYEWLPYNMCCEDKVPADPLGRRAMVADWYRSRLAPRADRYRSLIIATYGERHGQYVRYIEAFEPCEYGAPLTEENKRRLFPFLPTVTH